MEIISFPKQKPFRSKKAVEWFRTQPCDKCGENRKGYVTGHHEPLNGHGTSSKGPDDEQIPLCFQCHRVRHDKGKESFYGGYFWRYKVMHYYHKVHKYLEK